MPPGAPPAEALLIALGFAFFAMLLTTFWSYWRDGWHLNRLELAERLRLKALNQEDWLWGLGTGLFMAVTFITFSYVINIMMHNGLFSPPEGTPELLYPLANVTEFTGRLLPWAVLVLLLKIFGEELWCRGYLLPRQERSNKNLAWLVNGVFWCGLYAFAWWLLPALLPGCLVLSWVSAKREKTTVSLLAHGVFVLGLLISTVL